MERGLRLLSCVLLFGYALAEAPRQVEWRSREARLRLRETSPDLLSSIWSDEVMAGINASMG